MSDPEGLMKKCEEVTKVLQRWISTLGKSDREMQSVKVANSLNLITKDTVLAVRNTFIQPQQYSALATVKVIKERL